MGMYWDKNLRSCFPVDIPGIFRKLATMGVPWEDTISGEQLDTLYLYNQSGMKTPSPLVYRFISQNDEPVLTEANVTYLATLIYSLNIDSWSTLWGAEQTPYNPLENYSMLEEMTDDITEHERGTAETEQRNLSQSGTDGETMTYGKTTTRTDQLARTETGTDNLAHGNTRTKSGTDSTSNLTTPNLTDTVASGISGFDSVTPVDTDHSESRHTGTSSEAGTVTYDTEEVESGTDNHTISSSVSNTGTQAHATTGTDGVSKIHSSSDTGTVTRTHSGTDTDTRNYTLTRTGNIGVTTSQQMLESERNIRSWRYIYDRVFPDVDRVLTLSVY